MMAGEAQGAALTSQTETTKYALNFEEYLLNVFNSFTGATSTLKELATGNYVVEFEINANADHICNVKGGQQICGKLRLLMNRHVAFADLSTDEIVDIASNMTMDTFDPMFAQMQEYEIKNLSQLESLGLAVSDSLFAFLTSLRDKGIRDLVVATTSVTYVNKSSEGNQQAQVGIYNQ